MRCSSASGFCVGCALRPPSSFRRSGPEQIGKQPVGAHLQVVVQRLEALVVEGRARALVARRPDQRLVRVGEALAAEVRHRVHLAPDDVVLDPEAEVLQRGAEAEDVVIGADHPDGAVGLQDAAALGEPGAREGVVVGEARELVPLVVDAVDARIVGPHEVGGELQIVGRVGEDEIDACVRAGPSGPARQSPTMTRLAAGAWAVRRRTMGTQLSDWDDTRPRRSWRSTSQASASSSWARSPLARDLSVADAGCRACAGAVERMSTALLSSMRPSASCTVRNERR